MSIARKSGGSSKPKPYLLLTRYYRELCLNVPECRQVISDFKFFFAGLVIFLALYCVILYRIYVLNCGVNAPSAASQGIPYMIVLWVALLVMSLSAGSASLVLSPPPLIYLYSWFAHHYLKKIYSPQFDEDGNIHRYVKLDIYLSVKCFARKTKYRKMSILIPITITAIAVPAILIFSISVYVFVMLTYFLFFILGFMLGRAHAKIYTDVVVKKQSCYESSRLSGEIEDAITNLGLGSDPYRLFSDHKATIGFSTLITIFSGFLWHITAFKNESATFDEILRKIIWTGASMSCKDMYEFALQFPFMLVLYFAPFALTVQYYMFVCFTLKYLGELGSQNESLVGVKEELKRALLTDLSGDVAIPLMSMFLRYMWTGKMFTLGGLNLRTSLYALMLVSLLDLPIAPVAYYLKFIVEPALRRLFGFRSPCLFSAQSRPSEDLSELCNTLIRLYCKYGLASHSWGSYYCKKLEIAAA